MTRQGDRQTGFSIVEAVVVVAAVAVMGVAGWAVYQHNKPQQTGAAGATQTPNQTTGQQQNNDQVTTKTYTSGNEHATFEYPSNWTLTRPKLTSNDAKNTDQTGLTSPSGALTISYVTDITGFGNEHTDTYPYNIVVDKTPITHAPGLYVVSGITTLDGTSYYPWLAVQSDDGILTTGVQGDVLTYASRHALNTSTNALTRNLFATAEPRATQNSPAMSKDQATAWFSGDEQQQAKQILLSFEDAN